MGDRGSLARASGTSAIIIGHTEDGKKTRIRMPSGVRLVVGIVCLEKRFLSSLSTSNDSNHGSAGSLDGLSHARWHSNTGLLAILGVTNDDSTGARGSSEGATVAHLSFNVGDDGSFWHAVDRDDIADSQGSFRSSMNILTGVHALDSDEILSVSLHLSPCSSLLLLLGQSCTAFVGPRCCWPPAAT